MADVNFTFNPDAMMDETLGRISKKPGVKATIVIDRTSGAILKTTGKISSTRVPKSPGSSVANQAAAASAASGSFTEEAPIDEDQATVELALTVWNFIGATDSLIQDLDAEDELKLLRLRTKKQELLLVPGGKFLLIVVHDTPRV